MGTVENRKTFDRRKKKVLIGVIVILFFNYLLAPVVLVAKFTQKLTYSPDRRDAVRSVAKLWDVSEIRLISFESNHYTCAKKLVVIDPLTLSSADTFIAESGCNHNHTIDDLISNNFDVHLGSQYKPRNFIQKLIAFNFYTNLIVLLDESVIMDIKGNIIGGRIIATSTKANELRYPYILTFPIPFMPLHVDY